MGTIVLASSHFSRPWQFLTVHVNNLEKALKKCQRKLHFEPLPANILWIIYIRPKKTNHSFISEKTLASYIFVNKSKHWLQNVCSAKLIKVHRAFGWAQSEAKPKCIHAKVLWSRRTENPKRTEAKARALQSQSTPKLKRPKAKALQSQSAPKPKRSKA